ncbi:hypothetical protein P9293_18630 [Bacillus inaquosorum]|uniref:hypothetical protein n=1 Tax=Bacillus inaquosorum TaxID=483913 RepID=UPI00037A0C01|nr:hypothetical protein [Bacillus inaquosorum]ARV46884.1 hypothetical protein BCV50_18740 [Bacillus subtilis]MEC2063599.1 hypothetical protein [Bacillus inaquosorum]MEC2086767.1 hypothetical protein [Bacillus inaquosorum]MED4649380.1 hypothetical protein [Bacillus inaquosorum]MED4790112.1 hypothetical protein [Bacillus inaquosorum]
MEVQDILDWAFRRHLNPLSWYIRPLFLLVLVYAAYKRSWKGIIITFVLMMSSMVWFPEPKRIYLQMQKVLEFEQMLLSSQVSAVLTIVFMMVLIGFILAAFWKRSLVLGVILLNVTLAGKVALSLFFTGESGWAPLGNTIFGLMMVNGIGLFIKYRNRKKRRGIDI